MTKIDEDVAINSQEKFSDKLYKKMTSNRFYSLTDEDWSQLKEERDIEENNHLKSNPQLKEFVARLMPILEERQKEYGDPQDSLKDIARRWAALLNIHITPHQVGLMMLDLKIQRLSKNPRHYDSLLDIAGYAACLSTLV